MIKNLHGKMIVADDKVLIISTNLNEYGLKMNRETGIVIYDKRTADYLAKVFNNDWKCESNTIYLIPTTMLFIMTLALAHKWFKIKGG